MQDNIPTQSEIDNIFKGNKRADGGYVPVFFRLDKPDEFASFKDLITTKQEIEVVDTLDAQLRELIKANNPKSFYTPERLELAIAEHLNGNDKNHYGVWVYYSWLNKVVHILDEAEFSMLRTNRNKYKITEEEQNELSTKRIGVVGLSVGQSVSLTIAIEKGCGEIRIADFDTLDLTNLNRIRTGIHNIGLKKTIIVAREIAEIDPFLKVICYHDGINENNIDDFLTSNGTLDLLIDECDSFDIKIALRQKAKDMRIPVLMEGSDRCTIDIERFDLENDRPLLHGFIGDLDMSVYKTLKTMDEKLPYIAPVTGIETLSPRMKASAVEIMNTISTWPQLASAVTYGGGITAEISRKILLGASNISGRFFIDVDDLFVEQLDKSNSKTSANQDENVSPSISHLVIEDAIKSQTIDEKSEPIAIELLNELIVSASRAPSGGNNQPWHFHYDSGRLYVFLNKSSSGAYLDPDFISSYSSIGAAIANISLEAAKHNVGVKARIQEGLNSELIAVLNFEKNYRPSARDLQLAAQLVDRHTNRKIGTGTIISNDSLEILKTSAEAEGVALTWVTEAGAKIEIGDICGEADLLRMFIPEAHTDFILKEMRWNQKEIDETEDGIGIDTLDLTNSDQIGLRLMKDPRTVSFLSQIKGGNVFKELAKRQFMSSGAAGVITIKATSPADYVKAGIAFEKVWLHASALGLQFHPVNVPLIFFYKNKFQNKNNLSLTERQKITDLHHRFKKITNIPDDQTEVFLFRLFNAEDSVKRTTRKSINKILTVGNY